MSPATKVLIVSRDARVREPATEILLRNGFVVDEARDAAAAMRVARSPRPPQVVLVDTATLGARALSFLDGLDEAMGERGARTVLLAGEGASEPVRRHPTVGYVIEAPAAVRNLMALSDWLEGKESGRLRPVARSEAGTDRRQRAG